MREGAEPSRRRVIWGVSRWQRGGWSARHDACRRSPERLGVVSLYRTRPGHSGRLRGWSLRRRRWLQARIGWIDLLFSYIWFGL
ncbi:extensin precursor [Iris pallida]|uniref:Extensin n=1 Tax=Iris pallida TaxID=29817 RepID=A0AAX6FNT6_IRIPA|nr:extensin precursor [Iris pallida]